jgi:hypothetical protein
VSLAQLKVLVMKRRQAQLAIVGVIGALVGALATSAVKAAADPALLEGNPVVIGSPTTFSGVGGTNTSGGALTALQAFEAAIGGVKNTAASPQTNGFRTITWDGVMLDGTDFGGDTTVIVPNKVVGIPINRFETLGAIFEEIYAVSGDGFKSVNPNVNTASPELFPAFSPANTFAMFNDNTIGQSFVFASAANLSPQPAATRGFGAIFLNVRSPNTTNIEYFNGTRSLGKFFAPVGAAGQAEFLGVLFSNPIVTSIEITCGTDVLFSFDGITVSSSSADNPPTHNLVVTDDFVYAEPTTATNAQPHIAVAAGSALNDVVVATFSDLDPSGDARNFTATIDWGDGHFSPGTIMANTSGGFDVRGSNTFAGAGTFPITVAIADLEGAELTIRNTAVAAGPGVVLNISTRGRVETGDDVLIGGFVIGGSVPIHIVVRALGPSLASFNVPGALQDPTADLFDASGMLLVSNDNWKDSQQAEIQATGLAPTDDRESAIAATLPPGRYTVIVRGKNSTSGVGLVEVFNK